jgi:hypothetical protein
LHDPKKMHQLKLFQIFLDDNEPQWCRFVSKEQVSIFCYLMRLPLIVSQHKVFE